MLYFHYGRHQLAILKPNAVNVMGCSLHKHSTEMTTKHVKATH